MARLRRRLPAKHVAARAGMSPMTLRSLERGGAGVTLGAYLAVMQVLGIEKDLDLLGQADPLGRELQDGRLSPKIESPPKVRLRNTLKTPPAGQLHKEIGRLERPLKRNEKILKPAHGAKAWIEKSGFASSQALANLIDPSQSVTQKKKR